MNIFINNNDCKFGLFRARVKRVIKVGLMVAGCAIALPALASNCVSPPSGLVGWWPGDGNFYDWVGTNNGVNKNGVDFVTGEVDQAFGFDGLQTGVALGNPISLQLQNFTIEAWVKRSNLTHISSSPDGGAILCYGTHGYGFGMQNDGTLFLTDVGYSAVFANLAVMDMKFHHVAVTKAGQLVIFYVDGLADAPLIYNANFFFTTKLAIGARGDNLGNCFEGVIDEISVYKRALSAAEIMAIYNAGGAGKGKQPLIVTQPESQSVFWGQNVSFHVVAVGTEPLSYAWQKEGITIAGETNAALVLTNVQMSQAGSYTVHITNEFGNITSSAATLSINPPGVSIALYAGITIEGVSGKTYGIQYCTNLNQSAGWLGLTNLTLTVPIHTWYDAQPANQPQRFYRVVPGPISIP